MITMLMISKKSRKGSHLEEVGCNGPELSRKILVLDDELVEGQLPMLVSQKNLFLGLEFLMWLVLYLDILFVLINLIFLFYCQPIIWGFPFHYREAFSHMVEYSRSETLISTGAEIDQHRVSPFNFVSIRDREIDSNTYKKNII